ncbi:hypothetical protein [Flavivirga algicola]|uniref:Uncharacterized protein n=1 Tax=Flavivirga algicola TaxID=2729136 RepID=A0ABX1S0M1_9FLAO|nr:hypothetical protein [Flavivirga algicola]NMH89414.1 hypothetical protein [Flavivirga algicola]
MEQIKQHITFKITTLLLVAVLLVPTAVKFAHILSHHEHEHEVCLGEQTTHLHEIDLDCEFYKFQLNNHFLLVTDYDSCLYTLPNHKVLPLTYKFLNNYRQLSFSLRGPPVLI